MTIESQKDVDSLMRIGRIVAETLKKMQQSLEPGMTTRELDAVGRDFLERHGARSAPEICYRFPAATCISINEEAAHGIPGDRVINAGDVVNIDVSAELDGYFADTGGTVVVPPVMPLAQRLCDATRMALKNAIAEVSAGRPMNVIGKAIQKVSRESGFNIIRNLCSHGVGRHVHEEPKSIPGYYDRKDTRRLVNGMVITIEPFLSTLTTNVRDSGDGWTLVGPRGTLSAQYEHTMIVTKGKPILVTALA